MVFDPFSIRKWEMDFWQENGFWIFDIDQGMNFGPIIDESMGF